MKPSRRGEPGLERRQLPLWFSVFIGPLAWAADFAIANGLTQRACAAGVSGFLFAFSAMASAAAFAGLFVALRARRTLAPPARATKARRADPSRFLALSGIVLSAGFLLAILASALPRLVVDPCA